MTRPPSFDLRAAYDLAAGASPGAAPHWWVRVHLAESGSTIYGTSTGDDDRDLTMVGFETWGELVRGETRSVMMRTRPGSEPSGPGDVDVQCHTVRKFVSLVAKGNPSILSTLWSPSTTLLPLAELRTLAHSRSAGRAYLGYATQQLERMQGRRGQMNVKRLDLIAKYGFDTKYAYHALRLVWQGVDFARTGVVQIPLPERQREALLKVRAGRLSQPKVEAAILGGIRELEGLVDGLPPDADPWPLIADLYGDHWDWGYLTDP